MINEIMARQILDMMDTTLEAAGCIRDYIEQGKTLNALSLLRDFEQLLITVHQASGPLKAEQPNMNLPAASASCLASLRRISAFVHTSPETALKKLEYELEPLLEEMRCNFYFWATVYENEIRTKRYYNEELQSLFTNRYMEEAERRGSYRYDVSIAVRGYNKLQYTKICVQSLLENLPQDLRYELILVNHGSSDGTKEYFESIRPDKQLDIEVNGGGLGAVARIIEGKYFIQISNDIVVTKNAIGNLYRCISSDDSIGWVVPATSNVSNLQTIPCKYESMEEMRQFAAANNCSDENRWEQRTRLVNPVDVLNVKEYIRTGFNGYFYDQSNRFPDDRLSLLFRRRGKKILLAKDAYCHHFGSVTHNASQTDVEDSYRRAKEAFHNIFGVDPWDAGFCYDFGLLDDSQFFISGAGHKEILGINCGIGSDPLKVKELLKENSGNKDIFLQNLTNEPQYLEDLRGVSDCAELFGGWDEISPEKGRYDYIVAEGDLEQAENCRDIIGKLLAALSDSGVLMISLQDTAVIDWLVNGFDNCLQRQSGISDTVTWVICRKDHSVLPDPV